MDGYVIFYLEKLVWTEIKFTAVASLTQCRILAKLTSVMCDTLNTILSHQAPHRPHRAPPPSSKCLHHSLYQRLRLAVLWLAVQLLIGITPANKIIFILVFRKSWSLNIITFHLIFLRQFPIKTEYKFLIAQ